MKHFSDFTLSIFVLFFSVIILSSCAVQPPINHKGKSVDDRKRIAIETTQNDSVLWESHDMNIKYKLHNEKDRFTISGTMHISYAILSTYHSVDRLYVFLYQLDKNGEAVGVNDISPLYSSATMFPDTLKFSSTLPKAKGAVSLAFAYWGYFEGGGSKSADLVEVFHNPFATEEIE